MTDSVTYLVTFQRDWADEFDVYGFALYTQQQVDLLMEWASTARTDWFGTNEGWEDTVLLDAFTFKEINADEHAVLDTLFPTARSANGARFGHIPMWWAAT